MKPKKLIRVKTIKHLPESEYEYINFKDNLNYLYSMKVIEELEEIKNSNHTDITEFVDLITVSISFAKQNGFSYSRLLFEFIKKIFNKGFFSNIALNKLNPNNPSNKIYFN